MATKFFYIAFYACTRNSVAYDFPRHGPSSRRRHDPRSTPAPGFSHTIGQTLSSDINSVIDFGAISNCENLTQQDNTVAFQNALNSVAALGGGILYAPPGCYSFSGEISVPEGVTLQGSWQSVPSHDYRIVPPQTATDGVGTTLMPLASRNDESGTPFITIDTNAKMAGVVVLYPDVPTNEVPVPYPFSIALVGANSAVTDVELLNSFNGISAVAAHRHYIARIQGQPTNIGIFLDETYDIGRIEDVHFNPWYSMDSIYFMYQLVHGRAFVLGRSDWEYVFNTFAFGYAVGYHFINTDTGNMNGNFLGIGADLAYNASVLVDGSQSPGILITNGEFTAFTSPDFPPPTENWVSVQAVVGATNTGPVKFVDSSFWGPSSSVATVAGSGSTSFVGCEFVQWALQGDETRAAIEASGSGPLIVSGSTFQDEGKTQLALFEQARRVVFMGNALGSTGSEQVLDNTGAGVSVVGLGLNV